MCATPSASFKCSLERCIPALLKWHTELIGVSCTYLALLLLLSNPTDGEYVSQETHEFVKKVFEKSGIDNNGSYLPKNLHPQHTLEPHGGQDESFAEARLVMGGAVEDLLKKTGQLAGSGLAGSTWLGAWGLQLLLVFTCLGVFSWSY
jgi:hypothetical protein